LIRGSLVVFFEFGVVAIGGLWNLAVVGDDSLTLRCPWVAWQVDDGTVQCVCVFTGKYLCV